jgi:hypothetical protein
MKTFLKDNWYKLMLGSSMMMASFGFMIHSISPAYSYNNDRNFEIQAGQSASAPVVANGVIVGEYVHFVDGGNLYTWRKSDLGKSYPYKAWSKTAVE